MRKAIIYNAPIITARGTSLKVAAKLYEYTGINTKELLAIAEIFFNWIMTGARQ